MAFTLVTIPPLSLSLVTRGALWMKRQADRLDPPGESPTSIRTGRTSSIGGGESGKGLLGFRRGVALLAVKAFLVSGLPVLIGPAGFELRGFPANAADWESWFRGDRDVGMNWSPGGESSDCTR
jgi:hypothetical protein